MGKWRTLFEANRPTAKKRGKADIQYDFGLPATAKQLTAAEKALGVKLPADIRELLSEFNGVWYTTPNHREFGLEPEMLFLDMDNMAVQVPEYFRTCGNVLPPEADLKKVVFFAQSNGFANLYGVCLEAVAGRKAGEVVHLDHEVGKLEKAYRDLADFVRRSPM